MNLAPVIVSLGIALTSSLYYLQAAQDNPERINYRSAMMEFEEVVDDLSEKSLLGLPMSVVDAQTHCNGLNQQFAQRLPNNTQWDILVAGLDCDIATVSLTTPVASFPTLVKAAVESGIAVGRLDYISNTTSNTLQWTHRLRHRSTADLGIRSQLQRNNTSICYQCCDPTSDCHVNGLWSYSNWVCNPLTARKTRSFNCSGTLCDSDTLQSVNEACDAISGFWRYSNWTCDAGSGRKSRTATCSALYGGTCGTHESLEEDCDAIDGS